MAVAGSRRSLDLLWVVLAATGILLLAPLGVLGGMDLDPVGVAFALLAGCLWASYILLSARTGSAFPGGTGLVIALCVGTLVLAPVGIAGAGQALLDPKLLLAGFGVAMLSSAIPFSLELEALRKIPAASRRFDEPGAGRGALAGLSSRRTSGDARRAAVSS